MRLSENFVFPGEYSREGENILHYLCRNGGVVDLFHYKNAIIDENRYLVKEYNPRGQQCVHIVACEDKVDPERKLRRLIEWGANINAKESLHGDTPLHIAVRTKNYKLAEWMCQQPQVNIEALNYAQQTPYHLAYKRNDDKMMTLLQKNGAQRKTSRNTINCSQVSGLKAYQVHLLADVMLSANESKISEV